MLYLIGLGLHDEKDVTVRGLEIIKRCEKVYLEAYTSILGVGIESLESFYGCKLIVADRELVETGSDSILESAKTSDVAFLVVGDPLGATTHADLILRAHELNIQITVVHNASVMNAIGATGIALYNYGQTISIPFFTDLWRPASFMEKIYENRKLGLHTLCLLDIKVKEQSEENFARGRKIYEPPRFMSVTTALSQILSVLDSNISQDPTINLDPSTTLVISISRLGAPDQKFIAGTMQQLATLEEDAFGKHGLHCLVILGSRLNPIEKDVAKTWCLDATFAETWEDVCREVYKCI